MKKFWMGCLVLAAVSGTAMAAPKRPAVDKPAAEAKKQVATVTFYSEDIECEQCAAKIMNNIPTLGRGVRDVRVDIPAHTVTIAYDAAKTSPEELREGLAKLSVHVQQ